MLFWSEFKKINKIKPNQTKTRSLRNMALRWNDWMLPHKNISLCLLFLRGKQITAYKKLHFLAAPPYLQVPMVSISTLALSEKLYTKFFLNDEMSLIMAWNTANKQMCNNSLSCISQPLWAAEFTGRWILKTGAEIYNS